MKAITPFAVNQAVITLARAYPYHSFEYKSPEDLADHQVIHQTNAALISYRNQGERIALEWAAKDAACLVAALDQAAAQLPYLPLAIEFVPECFVPVLEKAGYKIEAEFIDFFVDDLQGLPLDTTSIPATQYLPKGQPALAQVVAIDQSVSGTTRGYFSEDMDFLQQWQQDEHAVILTCRSAQDALLGFCCVTLYGFDSPKGPTLWLRKVAVHPQAQAKGIGRTLVTQALDYGRQRHATRAFLACDVENQHAIALYQRAGFRPRPGRGQINMLRG